MHIPKVSIAKNASAVTGGLVAVEAIPDFGNLCCWIQMHRLFNMTQGALFTIMMTNFTNQLILLQEHMKVAVLVDPLARVAYLGALLIPAEKEAQEDAEGAAAIQGSLLNDDDKQKKDDDPQQQNCREKIKIPNQFDSPRDDFITMMTELQEMWDGQ